MVWQFTGVYIINRTLHGRLEIRNFSSRVEKIFRSFAALTCEIFSTLEEQPAQLVHPHNTASYAGYSKRNFVSPRGHVISSIHHPPNSYCEDNGNFEVTSNNVCSCNEQGYLITDQRSKLFFKASLKLYVMLKIFLTPTFFSTKF